MRLPDALGITRSDLWKKMQSRGIETLPTC